MQEPSSKIEKPAEECIKIDVSNDRMKVFLSCALKSDDDIAKFSDQVISELKKYRIAAKPDMEMLTKVLSEARNRGKVIDRYLLAEGTPPVEPVDGKMEWTGDYFKDGYYIDPETKRIDFHRRLGNPNVEKDQLLVKIFYGRHGTGGRDVFGRVIPVRKARMATLKAGRNVVWDEGENGFRAKCDGRVRLKGQTLDIDQILFIREGINNDTGNIKHNGQVIVNGDIDSDFVVEATGNIEVRGLIYASDIKCGGNLIAKEGINENLSKQMMVAGDIQAKYIMNGNVDSYGNIIVNREIFQSQVRSRGEITCKKGRIVGGEITAAKGIITGEAGSKGDVKTSLTTGIDFYLQDKLKINAELIDQHRLNTGQMKSAYKKLNSMKNYLKPDQEEELSAMRAKIRELEEAMENIENENKEISQQIREFKNSRIIILDLVHPGTVLRIFDKRYVVQNALAGPVVASLDPVTGEIALSSSMGGGAE
jgi:uncharacterized protein (DUF342 family)